jgi:hypothetical protein
MARLMSLKASQILSKEVTIQDIPIVTLQRFSVLINMCAATALQLFPPLGLLNYAALRLPQESETISAAPMGVRASSQPVFSCKPLSLH